MVPSTRLSKRSGSPLLFLFFLIVLSASSAAAQATGRITGKVSAAGTGAPLAAVQVVVQGTTVGAVTAADGTYSIVNVPVGSHQLRAEKIGMVAGTRAVTVAAGGTVEASFSLSAQALGLDAIVVTGTAGASRRREVGNSIAQVNTADLPREPTQTVDLLQAAAPGIQVTRSDGNLGGGYNIRLRGNTSVSMSNQPIVYIDGVRMQSKPFPIGNSAVASQANGGGANIDANPLNNINPADIERIEIIKGSAATTLYGTEASAGVIQVFTKRGAASAPIWNVEAQQGLARSIRFGTDSHPYLRMDPYLRTGSMGNYSASVRGGGQALQYFASAGYEGGTGVLPQDSISKWVARGNFSFMPAEDLQVQWNSSYASQSQRNSPVGGNVYGIQLNAYRGFANYFNTDDPDVVNELFDQELSQNIERFTTGATVTYSPTQDLTNRVTIGYDFSNQEVRNILPFGFIFFPQGSVWNDTWQNRILTLDYAGTYSFGISDAIRSSFSWGGQTLGEEERRLNGYGENFPGAALPTVNSGATKVAEENRSKIWNAGFFLQNVFDVSDRYFLTLGMRMDGNSAFGSDFGLQMYPKASASWVISDEGFWREGWGTMKLRSAYGRAGRAPGAFDATRTWASSGWGSTPALLPSNLGNPDLGPEVTSEFELGFDGEWLDGRLTTGFTWYTEKTRNALFAVSQIPTNGFLGTQRTNIGELSNQGMEIGINASPVRASSWGWDVGLNVTTLKSKVLDLGGIPPFATGGGWVEEGYPVPALRGNYVRNGEVAGTPINCTAAAAVNDPTLPCIETGHIYGPTQPTLNVSPSTVVRLPRGITVSALGEFRGGHFMSEGVTSGGVSRSAWMPTCWDHYVNPYEGSSNDYAGPSAANSLALKAGTPARWVAACTPALSNGGYTIAPADFFVLRNVSAQIPVDFAMPAQVSNATLTLGLNNFWRWHNSEWLLLTPDMGNADALVQSAGTRTAPVWSLNASLRVQF